MAAPEPAWTVDADPHRRLRDDVHLLGEVLGETLRAREGEPLYALVEQVRALAKRAHAGDDVTNAPRHS